MKDKSIEPVEVEAVAEVSSPEAKEPICRKVIKQKEWKPVAEGLPTHGGQVLVSWKHTVGHPDNGPYVSAARYEMGRWDWNSKNMDKNRHLYAVQAWMDQPEPYKPQLQPVEVEAVAEEPTTNLWSRISQVAENMKDIPAWKRGSAINERVAASIASQEGVYTELERNTAITDLVDAAKKRPHEARRGFSDFASEAAYHAYDKTPGEGNLATIRVSFVIDLQCALNRANATIAAKDAQIEKQRKMLEGFTAAGLTSVESIIAAKDAEILVFRTRAESAERRLGVFNSNGFQDADALAEKYLDQLITLAEQAKVIEEFRSMPKISYSDMTRLSRMFNQHQNLHNYADAFNTWTRINDWLKANIAALQSNGGAQ